MASSNLSAKQKNILMDRLDSILYTGEESDILFKLRYKEDEEKMYGHKLLFQIASPVFRALLSGDWAEKSEVEIVDEEPLAFKIMMRYIYTDIVTLDTVETACSVYKLADKYDLQHLKTVCKDYLLSSTTIENAFYVLEFLELYDETELTKFAIQLVAENMNSVVRKTEFLNCSQKILLTIVNQNEINITEMGLFKSITRWASCNSRKTGNPIETYATSMREIVNNIRFLTMTPDKFVEVPGNSIFLSSDEQLNILINLVKPGHQPLLGRFCTLTQSRLPKGAVEKIFTWVTQDISTMWDGVWHNSPDFSFNDRLWTVDMYKIERKEIGVRLRVLYYEKITVNFILKVKSRVGPKFDYCYVEERYFFNENEPSTIIPWDVIHNPDNDYLKDNKLTIEVWLKLCVTSAEDRKKVKKRWTVNTVLKSPK
ncbi:BTB/POZ domain-containing protein 1-like [Lycorma delicatula]|uniref:BTB/POZ domain-containing protein 1-like n=1 Tax=Lycorma delicatula TaxID=130591 RepID=UPI003F511F03